VHFEPQSPFEKVDTYTALISTEPIDQGRVEDGNRGVLQRRIVVPVRNREDGRLWRQSVENQDILYDCLPSSMSAKKNNS
jgi:hypothetical protein